jgi:hypothetical protein
MDHAGHTFACVFPAGESAETDQTGMDLYLNGRIHPACFRLRNTGSLHIMRHVLGGTMSRGVVPEGSGTGGVLKSEGATSMRVLRSVLKLPLPV